MAEITKSGLSLDELAERQSKLDARLKKIEDEKPWFIARYVLLPLTAVLVGALSSLITQHLVNDRQVKSEFIKLSSSIVLSNLDTLDLATISHRRKFLKAVGDGSTLSKSVEDVLLEYESDRLNKTVDKFIAGVDSQSVTTELDRYKRSGDEQYNMYEAKIKEKKSLNSKYDMAINFEKMGFEYLVKDSLKLALESFNKAENYFPTLHNISEIRQYLQNEIQNGNDTNTCSIKKYIVDYYSWKAPEKEFQNLKDQVSKCNKN